MDINLKPESQSQRGLKKDVAGQRRSTSADIRALFVDFFKKSGHTHILSAPLIPHDPSLLFTNAGMVQFKNIFSGREEPKVERAVSVQKCLRAGGKHNDLDNVGYTARHHTFFEMLGNFSFGDYFKEEAISYAWNFVTRELGLSPEKLRITVHDEDTQAADLWRKIAGIHPIPISGEDNFWTMGETGPCGPCTEIFYDHGDTLVGSPPPADGKDRFVEIWNLVFMQYQRDETGELSNLQHPGVDTGMGLERIAALMQGVHNNYDGDLFAPLIEECRDHLGIKAKDQQTMASLRVIADHFRACFCLLRSGLYPSNTGRGYVLRRIMRRALRHHHSLTAGKGSDSLWKVLEKRLCAMMEGQWEAEFTDADDHEASQRLSREQEGFQEMLGRGLKLLDTACESLPRSGVLDGTTVFTLYDTYGFPLDLTEDILRSRGYGVDSEGFDHAMRAQKKRARASWSGSGDVTHEKGMDVLTQGMRPTIFSGYRRDDGPVDDGPVDDQGPVDNQGPVDDQVPVDNQGVVRAMVVVGEGQRERVDQALTGKNVAFITDKTPFYALSGGQMGDSGTAHGKDGWADITDTRKVGDYHVHMATVREGVIRCADRLDLRIDVPRHQRLCAHHSATHLLHAALRRHLGSHVTQKGSLVAPDHLRFDISHPDTLLDAQIMKVEDEVNQRIIANDEVETRIMDHDRAVEEGALALFSERYAAKVRVVSMGGSWGGSWGGSKGGAMGGSKGGAMGGSMGGAKEAKPYSIELCGGTHVARSGEIGVFAITSQSAVGAGMRRIEACTGRDAIAFHRRRGTLLDESAQALKTSVDKLPDQLHSMMEDKRLLEKNIARWQCQATLSELRTKIEKIGTIPYAHARMRGIAGRDMKNIVDAALREIPSSVVALVGDQNGKASLVVGVAPELRRQIDAVDLVRYAVEYLGGKGGGGHAGLAQAGGPDSRRSTEALAAIARRIKEKGGAS